MSLPQRRLVALSAALLLALIGGSPALAHASLVSSDPEDRAVVASPPTVVTLRFSEGLDADKSSFRLAGPDGDVGTGRLTKDGGRVMALEGLTLEPGAYTIKWTVGSKDGHVERGRLTFTVSPPTPPPASASFAPTPAPASVSPAPTTAPTAIPSAAPEASEAPAIPAPASSTSGTDVLIPIVAGLLLVAGIGVIVLRRTRGA